jgi:orotidine-5'-phosphate decarboxylase
MVELTENEQRARKRICLALDVPTVRDALALSSELAEYVGMFKIGKQLHTAACNEAVPIVGRTWANGGEVFLDLKFHDTPQTVYEASKAAVVPGVKMFNVHVAGGEAMCKEACRGAVDGANRYLDSSLPAVQRPYVIGVTVLTSLNDADLQAQGLGISYNDLVMRMTKLAREWGLDGIVCPANKAGALEKEFGSDFLYVTPSIEWKGKSGAGQKQLYTPDRAVQDCKSSILVAGSAITKAADRRATAYEILQAMAPFV